MTTKTTICNSLWLNHIESIVCNSGKVFYMDTNFEGVPEYINLSLLWRILKRVEFTWNLYDDSNRIIDVVDARNKFYETNDRTDFDNNFISLYEVLVILCMKISLEDSGDYNSVYSNLIGIIKSLGILYDNDSNIIYTNTTPFSLGMANTVDYVKKIQTYFNSSKRTSLWELMNTIVLPNN